MWGDWMEEIFKPSEWITPGEACPRVPVAVEGRFHAGDEPVGEVVLEVTGLGEFRACLNGQRVGEDYLTPGCNDYGAYVRVYRYTVTDLLRPGAEERLTVWLGDGWYRGRYGIDKPPARGGCVWGDRYLLAARLTATDKVGRSRILLSTADPSRWSARLTPLCETSIYDGEVWDFTRPCEEVYPCVPAGGSLPERCLPAFGAPVRAVEVRHPTRLPTPSGDFLLDFGANAAGILRITGVIPHGQTLTVEHGEHIQDGEFCRDNLRTAKAAHIITGDGHHRTVEPLFSYFGFRYARLSGLDEATLAGLEVEMVVLSSAGEMKSDFSCDHAGLEELVACARRGQLSNFMDIPTDCPQRDERLGWGADAWIFAETACWLSDCRDMYEKYLYDLRVEQLRYYAGDLPMYTPSLRGEAGAGGAGWADVGVLLPWILYERYGDVGILSRHFPLVRDYTEQLLRREAQSGCIRGGFTFGDWLAGDGMTPQSRDGGTEHDFITNLFLYRVLSVSAACAAQIGETAHQARYEQAAARVKQAFLDEYVSPNGRLCADTQTAYVLALAFGLYRSQEEPVKGLERRLERDLWVMKTGFLGTPFLLPVLLDHGLEAAAWRILLRRDPPGWLYELDRGATTFWERWNSVLPDGHLSGSGMNSLNHYAYGSVCETLFSRVAGLRPTKPGFAAVCIRPHPCAALHRAGLCFESPHGRIETDWQVDGRGVCTLSGRLPQGVEATVILPDGQTYEGVREDFCFHSRPLSRLIHPFGQDPLLYDIIADPQAAAILRRHLPRAYAILTDGEPDFLTKPLRFLPTLAFFGADSAAVAAAERELAEITAWIQ